MVRDDEYLKTCDEAGWIPPYYGYGEGPAEKELEEAILAARDDAPVPSELHDAAERELEELGEPLYDVSMAPYAAEQCCREMASSIGRIDGAVDYYPEIREWHIDGWRIVGCPWCGARLPGSLESQLVDEVRRRGLRSGIRSDDDDYPEDLGDDRWWKAAGL